ncbi:hypothetical protein THAOC_26496, partial [Thalassiosira oceanica]
TISPTRELNSFCRNTAQYIMNCFGTHSTTSSYGLVGYDAALTRLRSLV